MTKSSDNIERAVCDTDVVQAMTELREFCPKDVLLYVRGSVEYSDDDTICEWTIHVSGEDEDVANLFSSLLAHEDDFRRGFLLGQVMNFETNKKNSEEI